MTCFDVTYELKIEILEESSVKIMVTSFLNSLGVFNLVEGVFDYKEDDGVFESKNDKKDLFEQENSPGPVLIYSFDKKDLELKKKKLEDKFCNKIKVTLSFFPSETWKEGWKKSFEPIDTDYFQVQAPWHDKKTKNGLLPVIIDPGMAFGTGQHMTTRLCLELLGDYHQRRQNKDFLPKVCKKIIVDNVLVSTSKITSFFYPESIVDDFDITVKEIKKTNYKKKVKHGNNVLIGKNVKIGNKCSIGHNTIIEKNVIIGNNCTVGSNVIIRNSLIKNNVHILDGCVIGKKGFGFFPDKISNFRYPQIGVVIIEDNAEIGCGSIIDRGSISNTIIGKNTYLDNQIHIAHNVKIGNNCIIAGQVGFAGSSTLGNNVMIGGQAGISGHLKIGNNVQIAGGSGVIKDIPDNSKVMGYPAKDLRNFLRENK